MIEKREITSRDEWLEWRKPDVTASNTGALFDCHPYVTRLKLYAEKRGVEFAFEDNKVLRRGRWLEPAIHKAVEELRPDWKLEPARHYYRDAELRIGATPDFFIHGDARGLGILQSKSVAPSVYARDWHGGTEVPLWIILQAATEAMMADAKFFVVAAMHVDAYAMDVSIHDMERNAAAEEKIKKAVKQFWADVDAGREPEPDFARDADVIKAMWRSEEPTNEIDLSGNNMIPSLLTERVMLKDEVKACEERLEAIDAQIKFTMQDAATATGLDGWRITFKTSHFKSYTVPARDTRVLRITDKRDK